MVVFGGRGGFAAGTFTINEETEVFVAVGGQTNTITGGFNGGGQGSANTVSRPGAGGGGATHISRGAGVLNTPTARSNLLLVAGGGGGASGDPNDARVGGHGGGLTGGNGIVGHSGQTSATGGTQTAGGNAGFWGTGWGVANPGTAGLGGNGGGPTSTSGGRRRWLVRWWRWSVGLWWRWLKSSK